MSARRAKWHPPPPPTPRILHLPRRSSLRSRVAASTVSVRRPTPPPPPPAAEHVGNPCGILEELFDQDRSFCGGRRARVESRSPSPSSRGGWGNRGDSEEEKWRLEAEVLRAECNFLRMDRGVALQKLESNRVQMEAALRSAVQTLVSGRKKIDGDPGMGAVLQEEIEELQSKLELLHRCSRRRRSSRRCTSVDLKPRGKSSGRNFDRKAHLLRRRLDELTVKVTSRRCEEEEEEAEDEEEEEMFVREIREIASEAASVSAGKDKRRADAEDVEAEARSCLSPDWRCRLHDVEILRRKIEGMSKVMLQRMESYESSLPASSSSFGAATAAAAAAAADSRAGDPRAAKARQGAADVVEEGKGFCSGRCREVVGRIMEQVRAESLQWNEMQGMLERVRREMEDLQCARDFWERCAVASDAKLRAATAQLLEWRQKAHASEHRVSELQTQVRELQVDVETLRRELSRHLLTNTSTAPAATTSPSPSRPHPRLHGMDPPRRIKCHPALSPPPQQQLQQQPLQHLLHKEKERRAQLRRSKENRPPSRAAPRSRQPPRRPPLQEIGNVPASPCRTRPTPHHPPPTHPRHCQLHHPCAQDGNPLPESTFAVRR